MRLEHLNNIRTFELDILLKYLETILKESEQSLKILEIGSGTGWQAKVLKENGYDVKAIDLPNSNYSSNRNFDIIDYDGNKIPFDDEYFDVVFSSNVLEHIPHIEEFQFEMSRVLKNDGVAIHILPSGTWRFWSNITYYLDKIKKIVNKLLKKKNTNSNCSQNVSDDYKGRGERTLLKMLIPSRHGEKGNVLSEIYYFSKHHWLKLFKKTNWTIEQITTNNLFYTGNSFLGYKLSISLRNRLSYLFGASCNIFILKKG